MRLKFLGAVTVLMLSVSGLVGIYVTSSSSDSAVAQPTPTVNIHYPGHCYSRLIAPYYSPLPVDDPDCYRRIGLSPPASP